MISNIKYQDSCPPYAVEVIVPEFLASPGITLLESSESDGVGRRV